MTAAENVCYTLINVTNDSEPPSEVSLKADLGKVTVWKFVGEILLKNYLHALSRNMLLSL